MKQLSHIPRQWGFFISQCSSRAHKTCLCSKSKGGCSVLSSWSILGTETKAGTGYIGDAEMDRAWHSLGKHEWTCCEWGVFGNNKTIKYSNAVEPERTKFVWMRALRTTRKISKYNPPWLCLHEKPNICRRHFQFVSARILLSNLWLDSGYWGWHWTVTDYFTFISHCFFCSRA